MFCLKCGKEIDPGNSFCTACGADLRKKCVRCGANLLLRAKFCPKCGSTQNEKPAFTQQEQVHQVQSQPVQPTLQSKSTSPRKKKISLGKIIGGIVVVGLFFIVLMVLNNNDSASYSAASKKTTAKKTTTPSYAKIECEDIGETSDLEWELLAPYVSAATLGKVIDPAYYTQADKDALRYASNYVRSHCTLRPNGVYSVSLYKYYNSETDYSMWVIFLRYSRINDDFAAFLGRTD